MPRPTEPESTPAPVLGPLVADTGALLGKLDAELAAAPKHRALRQARNLVAHAQRLLEAKPRTEPSERAMENTGRERDGRVRRGPRGRG